MTNTIKHAKGNQVYVSFKERQRFLDIQITNNGEQPKKKSKKRADYPHFVLSSKERAEV